MTELLIIVLAIVLGSVGMLAHVCIDLRSRLTLVTWKLDRALEDVTIERRRRESAEAQLDQLIALPALGPKRSQWRTVRVIDVTRN